MKKLLIFHLNIAPYRIDFFNSLHANFDTRIYLYYSNLLNQKFDTEKINTRLSFTPTIMSKGIKVLGREIKTGIGKIIKKNNPDIILTPEYSLCTLYVVLYRIITKKKYKIVTICDDSVDVAKHCNIFRKISRNIILRKIEGTIVCNNNTYQWYIHKYPNAHFTIFPIIQEESYFRSSLRKAIPMSNRYIQDFKLEGKKLYYLLADWLL